MSRLDREHGPRDADDTTGQDPHGENEPMQGTPDRRVDAHTGEILPMRGTMRPSPGGLGRGDGSGDADAATVQGERTIPSVDRERSIYSGGLALAAIILLGGGLLFWYYNTQYSKTRDAEESARRAAAARAGGEMKVPPLAASSRPGRRATRCSSPPSAPGPRWHPRRCALSSLMWRRYICGGQHRQPQEARR